MSTAPSNIGNSDHLRVLPSGATVQYKIFLSHSSDDKPFAEKIKSSLESIGMDVWLDNYEIAGGNSNISRIVEGIDGCDFFCIIYSPKANRSLWVRKELIWALDKYVSKIRMERSFIIPIYRHDTEFWPGIRDLHYVDFRRDEEFETRCDDLKNAILHPTTSDLFARQRIFLPATENIATYKRSIHERLAARLQRYVDRPIFSEGDRNHSLFVRPRENVIELASLVRKKSHIILNGDAGIGKSIELEHLAFEISSTVTVLIPVLCSLNKYVDQPLEVYVPALLQFPDETIVLILDGFDEVQAQHKNTFIRRLEYFCSMHPLCHIILSTRTNLRQEISDFENFYLLELDTADCLRYAEKELGLQAKRFLEEVGRRDYWVLIHHPFYLFLLVELFRLHKSLPQKRSDVMELFIHNQLESDTTKFRTVMSDIGKRISRLRSELERLALVAESCGRNFVTEADLKKLIPDGALREDLCSLSLLKKGDEEPPSWKFEHNNFQEYLAALVLSRHDLHSIMRFLTFDDAHKAFKPTWYNTAGFLLTIVSANKELFDPMLSWLHNVAPEVLIKSESDRIPVEVRFGVFRAIFEEFAEKRIHISRSLFNTRELGQFADSRESVAYLIGILERDSNEDVLSNAVELMRFMTIQPSQQEEVHAILLKCLELGKGHYLVCTTLLTLADLHLNDKPTVVSVIGRYGDSEDTWIRFGLYYFLYTSPVLDDYVSVFLRGMSFTKMSIGLTTEPQETRLGDESYHLQEGLKRVTSPAALKELISYFVEQPDDIRLAHIVDHLEEITNKIALAYNRDRSLLNLMVNLYAALVKAYNTHAVKIILKFFEATSTLTDLFGELFSRRANTKDWHTLVAPIMTQDLTEIVADEYLEGRITETDVWILRNVIPWENRAPSDWFLETMNKRTDNRFVPPPTRDYVAERKARKEADHKLLFDKDAFIGEVKRLFVAANKTTLSQEGLHTMRVDRWDDPIHSDLAFRALGDLLEGGPKTFDQIQMSIVRTDWELFAATKIWEQMTNGEEVVLTAEQTAHIRRWYDQNIRRVNFRTALVSPSRSSANAPTIAIVLWFLTARLDLECPHDALLDMLSFDWVVGQGMAGIGFIEGRLDRGEICERIIRNIHDGIDNESVLKNHLEYSKRNMIEDVVKYCPAIVKDTEWGEDVRLLALDVLGSFHSGIPLVRNMLMEIEGTLVWPALDRYKDLERATVLGRLRMIMGGLDEGESKRAVLMLVRLGDLEGVRQLALIVSQSRSAPGDIDERNLFTRVISVEAIGYIVEMLSVTYEPGFKDNSFYPFQSALLTALRAIALAQANTDDVARAVTVLIQQKMSENDSVRYLHAFLSELERDVRIARSVVDDIDATMRAVDEMLGRV